MMYSDVCSEVKSVLGVDGQGRDYKSCRMG